MALQNPILELEKTADGAIAIHRIVKPGSSAQDVAQAAAATDALVGVAQHAAADNERVRVMYVGRVKLEAGGSISDGDLLTSDASGQAVAAAPGAGTNNRVIAIALEGAASGDLFEALLAPQQIQG